MPKRALFIAAYDVSDPTRLRKVHKVVKRYATGGQKSVFECFLTAGEKRDLLSGARSVLDKREDRLALLRIEPRAQPILHGVATPVVDPEFFYVG